MTFNMPDICTLSIDSPLVDLMGLCPGGACPAGALLKWPCVPRGTLGHPHYNILSRSKSVHVIEKVAENRAEVTLRVTF